ncbi:MAG: hypothetical protein HC828_20185, partial [Blastochloris sp.]|nr:hypothetical protein [Blastochloris sp.]
WADVLAGEVAPDRPEVTFLADLQDRAVVMAVIRPEVDLRDRLPPGSDILLPLLPPTITIYEVH